MMALAQLIVCGNSVHQNVGFSGASVAAFKKMCDRSLVIVSLGPSFNRYQTIVSAEGVGSPDLRTFRHHFIKNIGFNSYGNTERYVLSNEIYEMRR